MSNTPSSERRRRQAVAAFKKAGFGVVKDVRDSGLSLADFIDNMPDYVGRVACQGCTECCYFDRVEVRATDNIEHLDTEMRNGELVLKKKPDGACIHLGPEGCTVYEHRPLACRVYDCRVSSVAHIQINHNGHREPAWRFGMDTPLDREYETALRLASVELFKKHNMSGWEMVHHVLKNFRPMLPAAKELSKFFDNLTPDQRDSLIKEFDMFSRGVGQLK